MQFKKLIKSGQKAVGRKPFKFALFLFVFYFTFVLRAHNYERWPASNHLDEMQFAWSGLYLIETGIPVSWSTLDYPKRTEVFKGRISYHGQKPDASVTLYKPWLDQPPLFSLVVGYFGHINGALKTDFVPSSYIRIPTVLMAGVTSIMIFLIARLASGYSMGIFSMFIYGSVPLFVFASRTALPENLIAMLLSLMIYLFLKFEQTLKIYILLPIPLLIGVAGLSKATGYFMLPLAIYLAFVIFQKNQRYKDAFKITIYLLIGTIPFVILFYWFGLSQDPQVFWQITQIQAHRPAGFSSLLWFFISPSPDTNILKDSWYLFCLVSAGFYIFKSKLNLREVKEFNFGQQVIILSFVYWLIIVMISGGENDLLAWYRFPTMPFLSILGAWGIRYVYKKADFFASFIAAGFLLGNRVLLVNAFRPNVEPSQYRLILSGLLLPSILGSIFKSNFYYTLSKIVIVIVVMIGTYFNVIYIYNAFDLACEAKDCPFVPTTKLSELHFPIVSKFFELGPSKYPH